MSLLNTLKVGHSGLHTASEAMGVIGNNTTNAATEGYSRQQLNTGTGSPYINDGLWIGNGVTADSITRITDIFVSERYTEARGSAAGAEASLQAHQIIETTFAREGGVADSLAAFFDALDELSADPGDSGHRLAAVAAGEAFATSVSYGTEQLNEIQAGLTEQIRSSADGINLALERVAELNGLIGQGGSSDLADERDRLVNQLADTIGVTADFSSSNGQVTVFLGGHALVMGDSARSLDVDTATEPPTVSVSADKGSVDITEHAAGAIGGLTEAWQTAQGIKDDLDEFIQTFAQTFNDQHQLGFDANGNPGGAFFTFSTTDPAATFAIDGALKADESLLALAASPDADIGDRGNLDLLSDLQGQDIIGGATPEGYLAEMYTRLGDAVIRAEARYSTETAALADAESLRVATSGVDLDEEAADLLRWQAAYQAAARVITTSNELLSELMNIV